MNLEKEETINEPETIPLRDKWHLGFIQQLPRETEPSKHWPSGGMNAFILPEKVISLKLLFDNLRNYALCAGFAAFGIWLHKDKAAMPITEHLPPGLVLLAVLGVWVLATVLLILNVAQSRLLLSAVIEARTAHRRSKQYVMRWETPFQMFMMFTTLFFAYFQSLIFAILMIIFPVVLLAIFLGFVWFGMTVKVS